MKSRRAGILIGLVGLAGAGYLLLKQNGPRALESDRLSPVSETVVEAGQAPSENQIGGAPSQEARQPGSDDDSATAAIKDEVTQSDAAPVDVDPRQRLFPGFQLIAREDSAPDSQGVVTRIELIQTKFKYPLIRVVEKRQKDPKTGQMVVMDQTMMVADHLLVQKTDGISDADFRALIRRTGADIRREGGEGPYLVSFDGRDLQALDKKRQEILKAGNGAVLADPDYIRTLR